MLIVGCSCGTDVHARALARWGPERQALALLEELGEAVAAVARMLNGKGEVAEAREEILDALSVVTSLKHELGTAEEWRADRDRKHAKLAAKLERDAIRTRPASPGAL